MTEIKFKKCLYSLYNLIIYNLINKSSFAHFTKKSLSEHAAGDIHTESASHRTAQKRRCSFLGMYDCTKYTLPLTHIMTLCVHVARLKEMLPTSITKTRRTVSADVAAQNIRSLTLSWGCRGGSVGCRASSSIPPHPRDWCLRRPAQRSKTLAKRATRRPNQSCGQVALASNLRVDRFFRNKWSEKTSPSCRGWTAALTNYCGELISRHIVRSAPLWNLPKKYIKKTLHISHS